MAASMARIFWIRSSRIRTAVGTGPRRGIWEQMTENGNDTVRKKIELSCCSWTRKSDLVGSSRMHASWSSSATYNAYMSQSWEHSYGAGASVPAGIWRSSGGDFQPQQWYHRDVIGTVAMYLWSHCRRLLAGPSLHDVLHGSSQSVFRRLL